MQVGKTSFKDSFTLFITILLFNSGVLAQSQIELSLNDYLSLLENKSIAIQQNANAIKEAKSDVVSTRSPFLPTIAAQGSYQRDFTKNFLFINDDFFGSEKFRTNFNHTLNADIIAEQTLVDMSSLFQYRSALIVSKISELSLENTKSELRTQGEELFWNVIYLKESLNVLEENKKLAKEQWIQMQDLYSSGLVSELEVRQTELYYRKTIPELASANTSYLALINELKTLASIPLDSNLNIVGSLITENTQNKNIISADLSNNIQLKMSQKELDVAREQIKVNRSSWLPIIKASTGFNYNAQDNTTKFKNDNRLHYGRVSIEIPILNGGYKFAQLQKAKINLNNIQLELQQQELNFKKELANAQLNYGLAKQKIESEKESLKLSEIEYKIAQERTVLGELTAIENKELRINLIKSKLDLLGAYLELRAAKLSILRITNSTL